MKNLEYPKVQIKLDSYLLKFFNHYFPNDIIVISGSHIFSDIFYSLLEVSNLPPKPICSESIIEISFPPQDRNFNRYDARVKFFHVPEKNQARFNSYLNTLFDMEVFAKVEEIKRLKLVRHNSGKMKECILQVLEKYGIEEHEMPYETIKKRIQRYENSFKTPINARVKVKL